MTALLTAAFVAGCVVSQPLEPVFTTPGDPCYNDEFTVTVESAAPPACRVWYVSDGTIVPAACIELMSQPPGPTECQVWPEPCSANPSRWWVWTVHPVVGGIVMFSLSEEATE
jgi:hypothetical protein